MTNAHISCSYIRLFFIVIYEITHVLLMQVDDEKVVSLSDPFPRFVEKKRIQPHISCVSHLPSTRKVLYKLSKDEIPSV